MAETEVITKMQKEFVSFHVSRVDDGVQLIVKSEELEEFFKKLHRKYVEERLRSGYIPRYSGRRMTEAEIEQQAILGTGTWDASLRFYGGFDRSGTFNDSYLRTALFGDPTDTLIVTGSNETPNLSILRAVGLKDGVTVVFNAPIPRTTIRSFLDKSRALLVEVYSAYLRPFDLSLSLSVSEVDHAAQSR